MVALRKESVDRNNVQPRKTDTPGVALRKESVDRNSRPLFFSCWLLVALRKESVDRNYVCMKEVLPWALSLSARRAWIEILASRLADMSAAVALRKESVDRNPPVDTSSVNVSGRSPQGERG